MMGKKEKTEHISLTAEYQVQGLAALDTTLTFLNRDFCLYLQSETLLHPTPPFTPALVMNAQSEVCVF